MEWVVKVQGHEITFYLDSLSAQTDSGLNERKRRVKAAINLLPIEHIRLIVEPVIVAGKFPGSRARGGGWFPHASAWMTTKGVLNTGVTAQEIERRVRGNLSTGIIGITAAAWLNNTDLGHNHLAYEYTVLHELGHSVDHHRGLIPPASMPGRGRNARYQGQRYPGGSVGELAAEAYSRFFLRPTGMCRGGKGTPPCYGPSGVQATFYEGIGPTIRARNRCKTQRWCSGRMQRDLRNTPAFAGVAGAQFRLANVMEENLPIEVANRYASNTCKLRGPVLEPNEIGAESGVSSHAAWRRPSSVDSGVA